MVINRGSLGQSHIYRKREVYRIFQKGENLGITNDWDYLLETGWEE